MKKALVLAFALVAAAMVSAQTTIEFWHAMGGKNGEITGKVIEMFNQSQKDFVVSGVYKGSYPDTMNAGIAAFRAGTPPAILQVYEVGTATMMSAKGAIKPVYELMKEQKAPFDPKAYIPTITGYYSTSKGDMLSMPFNSSTSVYYYNKDAFRKAGLNPDKPPKTWPEFFDVARKLKAAGFEAGFTTNWISWIQLENFSAWHNQPFGTKSNGFDGLDTELVFNSPLQVKHFENMAQAAKEGVFRYGGRENKANSLFTSGTVPMHFESIGGYGSMKATCKFDFGVAMMPYYPEQRGAPQNSIIGGASLWVMTQKDKKAYAAIASFFAFLSRPETQAFWHQQTGYLPITTAAYELTKSQGYYKDNPGPEVAIQQLLNKEPNSNTLGLRFGFMPQIRTIEDEQWEAILDGKITPKEGLDNMVRLGNEKLREFERINR
ncbi:sn-glycerol-3-phosphate ABC transporter substrate-binding protein UgpB [Treponema sp.]